MVQLDILSGNMAGTHWVARRFPVLIGRAAACHLQLEGNGIWEHHAQLEFDPAEGFLLQVQQDAIVTVNSQPVQSARLRNGDSISLGSVQIQFWLGDVRQFGLQLREWLVWMIVLAVTVSQVVLAYQLSK
jgi:pSer/pThr/pTyr-binding forkhead associated (FHA) protein